MRSAASLRRSKEATKKKFERDLSRCVRACASVYVTRPPRLVVAVLEYVCESVGVCVRVYVYEIETDAPRLRRERDEPSGIPPSPWSPPPSVFSCLLLSHSMDDDKAVSSK